MSTDVLANFINCLALRPSKTAPLAIFGIEILICSLFTVCVSESLAGGSSWSTPTLDADMLAFLIAEGSCFIALVSASGFLVS